MKKVGIFLSRMQPIHNAHLWMIENALKENDEILVMIGSANKSGTIRNPIPIDFREKLVREAINEHFGDIDRIKIISISDWSSEENNDDQEWGRLIYYNVVGKMSVYKFSYYCSEEPEKIKGWFEDEIKQRIDFRFSSRENEFNGLSATKVREAILNDDIEYIKKYCPTVVLENKERLNEFIKIAKNA